MKKLRQFFKGFQEGMKSFSNNISTIINLILLSIVYLTGVGFTSITAKFFGKHFLDIKKKMGSYWSDLNLKRKPIEKYYRQF